MIAENINQVKKFGGDKNMSEVKQLKLCLEKEVIVYYGMNIIDKLPDKINEYDYDKIFVLADEDVFKIHGHSLKTAFNESNINFEVLYFNCTEKDKNFRNLEHICNTLIQKRISKSSIIVSFGGGMAGNIFGLAASLIYRGVRYIEMPTTFMGQTDGTLSNKQAINGGSGKNQIGTYYAPLFVWSDISYIKTEKIRYIRAALVEGIKNTFIQDKETLAILEKLLYKEEYSEHELYNIFEIITDSKNKILKNDPTEKKYAVILEYGHTVGHAIEFLTMGNIIHGEAVAIGMCIEAEMSNLLSYLSDHDKEEHYRLLTPLLSKEVKELFSNLDNHSIYFEIQNDNKRVNSEVKYILLERMGRCVVTEDYQNSVTTQIIYQAIDRFRKRIYQNNMNLMKKITVEEVV